ncbi:MAG: hypothetical protein IJ783_04695, partial [Kiritimatiellae bacterium]|nr:hypothetical protein [Kiritimatiellia bacterium]
MNDVLLVHAAIDGPANDAIFRATRRGIERYASARGWKLRAAEVAAAGAGRDIRAALRRVRPIGCIV